MLKKIFFTFVIFSCSLKAAEGSDIDPKTKDAIELIRVSMLGQGQIDEILTPIIRMSLDAAKSDLKVETVLSNVKAKIQSNDYLVQFVKPINANFSQDEINLLITYYKSEAMKKFFKSSKDVFLPIFSSIQETVSNEIQPTPAASNVTTITSENFQKEVKDFKGTVLLEVYSPMCGPCKAESPIFSDLSQELNQLKFCKLDCFSNNQLAQELEIFSVPTILTIKDGKIIDRHVGFINKEDLKNKIVKTIPQSQN